MSDDKDTRPPSVNWKSDAMSDTPDRWNDDSAEDRELSALLNRWTAPDTPSALDGRIAASYRREMSGASYSEEAFAANIHKFSPSSSSEEMNMKRCSTCQEEFANKFSFCPVDGTPLNELAAAIVATPAPDAEPAFSREESATSALPAVPGTGYHLTILEDAGLTRRLIQEMREVGHDAQLTWPEFKRDPAGFTRRSASAYSAMTWRFFSAPNVAIATVSALLLMMTMVIGIVWLEQLRAARANQLAANAASDDLELQEWITEIPAEQQEVEKGPAGMNKGTGGGSKPKQEKPGGGGGGGREQQQPASMGKLPQASLTVPQVVAPDPNPPKIKNPSLPVAATIDADPLLFPPDARVLPYGDPKSKSTELSSGPGTGGGIGTGTGGGVGSGEGGGVGPGRGGNTGGGDRNEGGGGPGGGGGGADYTKVFSGREVTQKARILSKPEPQYTEEARKNQVQGTVILKAVFSSSGQVTNIRTVSGLPNGLTEKAIAAARQIRFTPAVKDGRPVSMHFQLEYNFNLY